MPASTYARRFHPLLRSQRLARQPQPPERCRHRWFTQNSQLLILSPPSPRPQLPFLYSPGHRLSSVQRRGKFQLSNFLTKERREYIRETSWLTGKYTLYIWIITMLWSVAGLGLLHEGRERNNPSPHEWQFWTRMYFRDAHGLEDLEESPNGLIEWARVASMYNKVLGRLEDKEGDGKGLKEQPDLGGRAGYDLEAKSEAWRQGYFETLMGCARGAERLDGWVRDRTRRMVFPPEVVIGPSNPDPRPCPPGTASAPREENCEPAFPSPARFYLKIITAKGFNTKQRLGAAIAYADWLDFKGMPDAAEKMHKQGLDIACSALPNPSEVIDVSRGVILESSKAAPSANILTATSYLATHYARNGNVVAALPMYLSILRARRSAPAGPPSLVGDRSEPSLPEKILSFIKPLSYPPPPPSGDTPYLSASSDRCEDAALMMYIGEILFATSALKREEGVQWTQQAVDIAQSSLQDFSLGAKAKRKCRQCASASLGNWSQMALIMAEDARAKEGIAAEQVSSGWRSVFGSSTGNDANEPMAQSVEAVQRWLREEVHARQELSKLRDDIEREQSSPSVSLTTIGTWMV